MELRNNYKNIWPKHYFWQCHPGPSAGRSGRTHQVPPQLNVRVRLSCSSPGPPHSPTSWDSRCHSVRRGLITGLLNDKKYPPIRCSHLPSMPPILFPGPRIRRSHSACIRSISSHSHLLRSTPPRRPSRPLRLAMPRNRPYTTPVSDARPHTN